MGKRHNEEIAVYDVRPFHSYCLTDDVDDDDDICVWKYGRELSYIYDGESERGGNSDKNVTSSYNVNRNEVRAEAQAKATDKRYENAKVGQADGVAAGNMTENSMNLTAEEFRERQVAYALSTARRNLTRMSQFILKLECRAGKVTKESIRQTLDATVADDTNAFEPNEDPTRLEEIEEIKYLSDSVWKRLYLIDRHWRRQTRQARNAEGKSPHIQLESEPDVKEWLREEMRIKQAADEQHCYFTVADLINGRKFEDWIIYLRNLCRFKDHPTDEQKLVDLAWRFLDRDLRGPHPTNPTRIEDFVVGLEETHERGGFDEVIKHPEKQEQNDKQAWKIIKQYWFSRVQY
ncbi:hypothetical protein GGS26DRAFT_76938 [Hypomontagnella submonticulosa]|nr:hypothetical protein GGS26DRAFT_76938 [Hypomontagnella submonticulosa]